MMRFTAIVLLPVDTENLAAALETAMAPFYLHRKVQPYRRQLGDYEVKQLLNKFAPEYLLATSTPHQSLLEQLRLLPLQAREYLINEIPDYYAAVSAGLDEDGIYIISTLNDSGQWDGWSLGCEECRGIVHTNSADQVALVRRLADDLTRISGPQALRRLVGYVNTAKSPDEIVQKDIELVSSLLNAMKRGQYERTIPAAIVTPIPVFGDGVAQRWHSCAHFDDYYENDTTKNWAEVVYKLYERFIDHFAVRLECHR